MLGSELFEPVPSRFPAPVKAFLFLGREGGDGEELVLKQQPIGWVVWGFGGGAGELLSC